MPGADYPDIATMDAGSDEQLLREAVEALRDRVHIPADRTCCPDCADDADAIDLITRLQERLLNE